MFKIGADPEMFLQDAAGAFVSAIGKIGGTKAAPLPLPIGEGFCVQEDNVAVEFNIPASASAEELQHNMQTIIEFLEHGIQNRLGCHFSKASAVSFPESELLDPRALEFGCEPDFCAWTGKKNPRPAATDKNLRSCGGHIHVGYEFEGRSQKLECIKAMDVFLGVPSTLMDEGELRKSLYGKWGAHRIKPYGVEYRTLSNFWVFDKKLVKWVWDNTARALDAVRNGVSFDNDKDLISEAINNNNKQVAAELVQKYNLQVV